MRLKLIGLGGMLALGVTPIASSGQSSTNQPPPPQLEFAFEELVTLGPAVAPGKTAYGSRNMIPITGGTFTGDAIEGTVIAGGADFQLTPTSGSGLQIEARYTLRADDGELISVRNCGGSGGTRLQFETRTAGPYAYLNADGFTGTIGLRLGGVLISVFK